MDDVMVVPSGRFTLERRHHDPSEPLRAWDAADEYALDHLAVAAVSGERWLVVNDSFGALATALADHRPTLWSDSAVAFAAGRANLERNGIEVDAVTMVPSTSEPDGLFDVVVVKVPRTLAFLEDELRRLRPHLGPNSVVVGAGMTKLVHRSTVAAFESIIGPTTTTEARRKARLLHAVFDPDRRPAPSSFPVEWEAPGGILVTSLPNVFSATGLDDGTGLFLGHLPAVAPGEVVLDLGCGNGVLAATLASRHPGIELVCCDESFQAIASAEVTVGRVTSQATFHAIDVLDGIADDSVDLVVLNPPFHVGGARTSGPARRMFAESRRVLRADGELRLVANRHLNYHSMLPRWFGTVDVVASDPRFVVLRARGERTRAPRRRPRRDRRPPAS